MIRVGTLNASMSVLIFSVSICGLLYLYNLVGDEVQLSHQTEIQRYAWLPKNLKPIADSEKSTIIESAFTRTSPDGTATGNFKVIRTLISRYPPRLLLTQHQSLETRQLVLDDPVPYLTDLRRPHDWFSPTIILLLLW